MADVRLNGLSEGFPCPPRSGAANDLNLARLDFDAVPVA